MAVGWISDWSSNRGSFRFVSLKKKKNLPDTVYSLKVTGRIVRVRQSGNKRQISFILGISTRPEGKETLGKFSKPLWNWTGPPHQLSNSAQYTSLRWNSCTYNDNSPTDLFFHSLGPTTRGVRRSLITMCLNHYWTIFTMWILFKCDSCFLWCKEKIVSESSDGYYIYILFCWASDLK